ncbi:malonate decarboxylase holo-[acyl-carrier-protein] synthase [Bordetella bronchialis]|uniref:Malonate decarboxylase holo-[acyl-carrier-protein] synthase n=1 Tax=Bordetella bronchialis TaxID=463025 RepID=A0A193G4I6_9BORD|nr:malonate decarboxylase holo-[acyl-carrier-protein] synthase [Bordetella bronchialis]ANN74124.1 malonate decarboxylase holo-[acyl-carrier-protein] synthase [Bordetella bronchialis]
MPESPARHALIELSAQAWHDVFRQAPSLARNAFVRDWAAAGHPVMRRRPLAGEFDGRHADELVAVGLPTPPAHGKQRIAFQVPASAIVAVRPPVALDVILACEAVPPGWRPTLDAVCEAAQASGVRTRVFGSLLWQFLTPMPYVGGASDVDLLWPCPATPADLDRLLRALTCIGARGLPRIDGEIVRQGAAVQWAELARAQADTPLLVKTLDGSRLWARERWHHAGAAS